MNDSNQRPDEPTTSKRTVRSARIGRIGELVAYEVSEGEMEQIENRQTVSIYFTFATSLLSIAVAFLIALLTTTIESDRTYTIFVIAVIIGLVLGVFLSVLGIRNYLKDKKTFKTLIAKIKDRLPPAEGIPI